MKCSETKIIYEMQKNPMKYFCFILLIFRYLNEVNLKKVHFNEF